MGSEGKNMVLSPVSADAEAGGGGGDGSGRETQLVLNVYDLTPLNQYTYWFGFGIFHSGIEVNGMEYAFGAHDFPVSGVFEVEPRSCPGFIYRTSIQLGRLNMPPSESRKFIETVAAEYHGDTYHLITKNCNHFTDDMAFRLTGKHIPKWVNRLARVGAVCSCLLPESLQVTTVKQVAEYGECMEDGSESSSADSQHDHIDRDQLIESDDTEQEKLLFRSATVESTNVSFVRER